MHTLQTCIVTITTSHNVTNYNYNLMKFSEEIIYELQGQCTVLECSRPMPTYSTYNVAQHTQHAHLL